MYRPSLYIFVTFTRSLPGFANKPCAGRAVGRKAGDYLCTQPASHPSSCVIYVGAFDLCLLGVSASSLLYQIILTQKL